jgi:hypothetical protein
VEELFTFESKILVKLEILNGSSESLESDGRLQGPDEGRLVHLSLEFKKNLEGALVNHIVRVAIGNKGEPVRAIMTASN